MKKTFRQFFLVLCLLLAPVGLCAQSLVFHECGGVETVVTLPADMHIEASGGVVTFSSGSSSVAIPLGSVLAVTFRNKTGDVNGDTQVDVADIATIISIMAGKGGDDIPGTGKAPAGVEAVDLGLPSGTKWANMNVGAEKPEDYGSYFAWGETQPKDVYSWDTYQYGSSEDNVVNIGSDIAGTGYDAATANWGSPWRMPSLAQIQELIDNTTSIWTIQNGVQGREFTGSNGGSVFLPAAGYRWYGELFNAGSNGYYWSSTLNESDPFLAYGLYFSSGYAGWSYFDYRYDGHTVRPVR
jgi:hypothetical protein